MRRVGRYVSNEDGSVVVISTLILALLTVMGISAATTASIELQIAGNDRFQKLAFYAADAARGYVARSPSFYGTDNITAGSGLNFPNDGDPNETYTLNSKMSFRGDVGYSGFSQPPRGSGSQAGKYKAHRYAMTCVGTGPANAQSQIEVWFYRLGF